MPYGKTLGTLLGDYGDEVTHSNGTLSNDTRMKIDASHGKPEDAVYNSYKWSVVFTILGTILLDFDCDNCLTPARAYLLDVSLPENHAKGMSTLTMMAGFGGCMGYLLGGVDWEAIYIGHFFGGNVKTVFALVTMIFLVGLTVTLTSFREIPLPIMEQDEKLRPITCKAVTNAKDKSLRHNLKAKKSDSTEFQIKDLATIENGVAKNGLDPEAGTSSAHSDKDDDSVTFLEYLKSIVMMPKALRLLCLTNFLSWMSHCCYCLYFTTFVGEAVFLGDPTAPSGSHEYQLFEDGIRFGCYVSQLKIISIKQKNLI